MWRPFVLLCEKCDAPNHPRTICAAPSSRLPAFLFGYDCVKCGLSGQALTFAWEILVHEFRQWSGQSQALLVQPPPAAYNGLRWHSLAPLIRCERCTAPAKIRTMRYDAESFFLNLACPDCRYTHALILSYEYVFRQAAATTQPARERSFS